jgi:hypothetical protein
MNTGILLEPFKWTSELESYQELLEESASSESKWPVFNDGKDHAAILMSVIFKNAKDYVYLYSHALSSDLSRFDIYYNSLKECINNNVDIKLLLQSQNALSVENPSIELIRNKKSENVKILTVEQSDILKQKLNNMDIHFAVSDGKRYRLEYDIKDRKATSSFNDPSVANVLKEAFDAAFDS